MEDEILAQFSKLKKSGGCGSTKNNTVNIPLNSEKEPDVTATIPQYGVTLALEHCSPLTPSKEDFLAGKCVVVTNVGEQLTPSIGASKTYADGAFQIQYVLGTDAFVIVVAPSAGKFTAEVLTGVNVEFDIPYIGMYVLKNPDLIGYTANVTWETIHTIDPKFLLKEERTVMLNFDELRTDAGGALSFESVLGKVLSNEKMEYATWVKNPMPSASNPNPFFVKADEWAKKYQGYNENAPAIAVVSQGKHFAPCTFVSCGTLNDSEYRVLQICCSARVYYGTMVVQLEVAIVRYNGEMSKLFAKASGYAVSLSDEWYEG